MSADDRPRSIPDLISAQWRAWEGKGPSVDKSEIDAAWDLRRAGIEDDPPMMPDGRTAKTPTEAKIARTFRPLSAADLARREEIGRAARRARATLARNDAPRADDGAPAPADEESRDSCAKCSAEFAPKQNRVCGSCYSAATTKADEETARAILKRAGESNAMIDGFISSSKKAGTALASAAQRYVDRIKNARAASKVSPRLRRHVGGTPARSGAESLGEIGRRTKAAVLAVECPACKAPPGKPCNERFDSVHSERFDVVADRQSAKANGGYYAEFSVG